MSKIHRCEECGFTTTNGRIMSNHKRWKHSDIVFSKEAKEARHAKVEARRYVETRVCPRCGENFTVHGTVSQIKRSPKFCSRSCANSRVQSDSVRRKKREKLSKPLLPAHCLHCNQEYIPKRSQQKYCSHSCSTLAKRRKGKDKASYYRQAQFRFNLKDFPEEFNFDLIEKYGWYRATNRGGDGTGVSRDHKISIGYGFLEGIDPKLIAHPANCDLMVHSDNFRKGTQCSITVDELQSLIENWETKYTDR